MEKKMTVQQALSEGYSKAIVFNEHSEGMVLNIDEIDFSEKRQRNIVLASKDPSNPMGLTSEEIAELLGEHIDLAHYDETGHDTEDEVIEAIKAIDFTDASNKIKEALSGIFFYWATDIVLISNE